jgi:hypothetical protein
MKMYSSVNDAYECIIDYLRNYLYFYLPLMYLIKHLNVYWCLKFFPDIFVYEIYSCIKISVAFSWKSTRTTYSSYDVHWKLKLIFVVLVEIFKGVRRHAWTTL